jgi:5-methylcytosine-specific restriction endonuclease McrA
MDLNYRVLVLDKSYIPIEVYNFEEAMCAWASGAADVISEYDQVVHTGHGRHGVLEVKIPSVIRLKNTTANLKKLGMVRPFSRNTMYDEYKGKCCYCGTQMSRSEMTIEHIIPSSKGGLSDWKNCLPCCLRCNGTKGDKTYQEVGFKLQYKPRIPVTSELVTKSLLIKIGGSLPTEDWRPYIYWSREDIVNDI